MHLPAKADFPAYLPAKANFPTHIPVKADFPAHLLAKADFGFPYLEYFGLSSSLGQDHPGDAEPLPDGLLDRYKSSLPEVPAALVRSKAMR